MRKWACTLVPGRTDARSRSMRDGACSTRNAFSARPNSQFQAPCDSKQLVPAPWVHLRVRGSASQKALFHDNSNCNICVDKWQGWSRSGLTSLITEQLLAPVFNAYLRECVPLSAPREEQELYPQPYPVSYCETIHSIPLNPQAGCCRHCAQHPRPTESSSTLSRGGAAKRQQRQHQLHRHPLQAQRIGFYHQEFGFGQLVAPCLCEVLAVLYTGAEAKEQKSLHQPEEV
eukprot:scaffold207828_cov21-Tisochrysis_lutea.AAC.1